MSRLLLAFVLLASRAAFADVKLAPQYAAMFEKGHRWTYEVAMDGKKRTVTCSVAEVAVLERAIASRIECDDSLFDLDDLGPEGIWLATADGIGPPLNKRDGMTNRYRRSSPRSRVRTT